MFPLGTVLFPHTPLALRIFEQRYLMMLGRVLDDEEPSFGVVLIERGSEGRCQAAELRRLVRDGELGARHLQVPLQGEDLVLHRVDRLRVRSVPPSR